MNSNYKAGGGNKPQPFIPKGNGEESGQYTTDYQDDFIHQENCTRAELERTLSKEELWAVGLYSDYRVGTSLNKAIRENKMLKTDEMLMNLIVNAIARHKLKKPVRVYRGIKVTREIFAKNFLAKYRAKEPITGSAICSTSRGFARAAAGAKANDPSLISLVFYIELPKGYSALPIEDIALDSQEREILLSSPRYLIDNITDCSYGDFRFKRIRIQILGAIEQ